MTPPIKRIKINVKGKGRASSDDGESEQKNVISSSSLSHPPLSQSISGCTEEQPTVANKKELGSLFSGCVYTGPLVKAKPPPSRKQATSGNKKPAHKKYAEALPTIFQSIMDPHEHARFTPAALTKYKSFQVQWEETITTAEIGDKVKAACGTTLEYLDDQTHWPAHTIAKPQNLLQYGIGVGEEIGNGLPMHGGMIKVWVLLTFPVHPKGILHGPNGINRCFTHRAELAGLARYPSLAKNVVYSDSTPVPRHPSIKANPEDVKQRDLFLVNWVVMEAARPQMIVVRQDDNRTWIWELILLPFLYDYEGPEAKDSPFSKISDPKYREGRDSQRKRQTKIVDLAAITKIPSLHVESLAGVTGWDVFIIFTPHSCSVDPLKAATWRQRAQAIDKAWDIVATVAAADEEDQPSLEQWASEYRPSKGCGGDLLRGLRDYRAQELASQKAFLWDELPKGAQHLLEIYGISKDDEPFPTKNPPPSLVGNALRNSWQRGNWVGLAMLEKSGDLANLEHLAVARQRPHIRKQFAKHQLNADEDSFQELARRSRGVLQYRAVEDLSTHGNILQHVKHAGPDAVLIYCLRCASNAHLRKAATVYYGHLASWVNLIDGGANWTMLSCVDEVGQTIRSYINEQKLGCDGQHWLYADAVEDGLPGAESKYMDAMYMALARERTLSCEGY